MSEISELLKALASLLWPIFAFVALFLFKNQIADVMGRMKKGKLLGQEIELSESLVKLQKTASAISEEVASLPVSETEVTPETIKEQEESESSIRAILHEMARSPKAALILLATEIEREARQVLGSVGLLKGRRHVPITQALGELDKQYGGLPGHVSSGLKHFWEIRNRLIHGGEADEQSILSAIDSGVTILKALQALPREVNVVYHPGVTVFSDPECKNEISNTKGVILETSSPSGARKFVRIFPTTKTHFKKARRVAWEWSNEHIWGETWYRDPDTNEIKIAWSSSMEFVGRHLDEV
jgi:hypothetical protein